MEAGLMKQYL